jgi:hypothetical protein
LDFRDDSIVAADAYIDAAAIDPRTRWNALLICADSGPLAPREAAIVIFVVLIQVVEAGTRARSDVAYAERDAH